MQKKTLSQHEGFCNVSLGSLTCVCLSVQVSVCVSLIKMRINDQENWLNGYVVDPANHLLASWYVNKKAPTWIAAPPPHPHNNANTNRVKTRKVAADIGRTAGVILMIRGDGASCSWARMEYGEESLNWCVEVPLATKDSCHSKLSRPLKIKDALYFQHYSVFMRLRSLL